MRRRNSNALVCQYIENLSSATLEKYADIIREIVGRRHGVYALYRREKLYYVGLATNLRNRLNAHLKDRHRGLWDRFSVYLTIDDRHLRELESLAIRIAQPGGNRQRGRFARSENLTRTLHRRFLEQKRVEWLDMIGKEQELLETESTAPGSRKNSRRPAVLAEVIRKAMSLRGPYKGKVYKARVRKDGTIRCNGKVFTSPSLAAESVARRPINGWWFWQYERAPGQWLRLRELRHR
jgi:Restriction Enzyme Adenine Methylase Associated/GIY-YIG catalytic domain